MAILFGTYDESTPPSHWRALLIGISYKNHRNKEAKLSGTINDAKRMKNFLLGTLSWR
jgi:hypothetical protein